MRSISGHRVTVGELATLTVEDVLRPEVQGDDTARLVRRTAERKRGAKSTSSAAR